MNGKRYKAKTFPNSMKLIESYRSHYHCLPSNSFFHWCHRVSAPRSPVPHPKQFCQTRDEMRYKKDMYIFICLTEARIIQIFIVMFNTEFEFLMWWKGKCYIYFKRSFYFCSLDLQSYCDKKHNHQFSAEKILFISFTTFLGGHRFLCNSTTRPSNWLIYSHISVCL